MLVFFGIRNRQSTPVRRHYDRVPPWLFVLTLFVAADSAGRNVVCGQSWTAPVPSLTDPHRVFGQQSDRISDNSISQTAFRPDPTWDYRFRPNPSPCDNAETPWGQPSLDPMRPIDSPSTIRAESSSQPSPYFSYRDPINANQRYGYSPNGLQFPSPNRFASPHANGAIADPSIADPSADSPDERGNCLLYMPFTSMAYTGGQTPSTGYNELFVPLMQSHTELLFADVRGLYNAQSAYQGSFGGGMRSLLWDSVILGGYGFYDYRHTESQNSFQQATVGVELMSWIWEARSNGYIPTVENNGSGSGHAVGTAFLQNNTIYLQGIQQTALSGVDAELGLLLAADPSARQELRGFVGGYFFNAPAGSQDLTGISTRLEARIYDLGFLGEGSRLEFGAIANYDDVNQLQVAGLVNVRIALGQSSCPGRMSLIERRMVDRPVRRHDLVTNNDSTFIEPATAIVNGAPATPIVVVQPGDDLKAAVESAPAHALVLIEGGVPFSVPNGIVLAPGENLVGGGTQLTVVGNLSGNTGIFIAPGPRPTIDRPNALGPVLTVNPDNAVMGMNIQGGDNAIYGYDADHLLISDVNISGTAGDGLYLDDVDGFVMNNVTVSQTGGLGVSMWNVNNSFINGLTISQTFGSALYYNCGDNVHLNGLTVDATGATDDAVRIHTQTHSVFTNFDIRNGTHNGLTIGSSTNVSFDQIKLTNIGLDGFQANESGTFTLSNLNMDTVGGSGLVINNTALVSVNNSTFGNVNNVISYLNVANYISGNNNVATGFTTLFTGTTNGGGSIQFTTPNATAP